MPKVKIPAGYLTHLWQAEDESAHALMHVHPSMKAYMEGVQRRTADRAGNGKVFLPHELPDDAGTRQAEVTAANPRELRSGLEENWGADLTDRDTAHILNQTPAEARSHLTVVKAKGGKIAKRRTK